MNGDPVVVAFRQDVGGKYGSIEFANELNTAFGITQNENSTLEGYLNDNIRDDNDVFYPNGATKKEVIDLLAENTSVSKPTSSNLKLSYASKKVNQEYMTAVESGDMEKAQELVNEQAKRNGFSTEQFYHATASEGFTKFDKNKIKAGETDAWYNGIWVTTDPDTSPSFRNAKKTYPLYIKYGKIAPADVANKTIKEGRSEWRNADKSNWNKESRSVQDEVRNRLESMGYGSIVFDDKVDINVDELERTGTTEWESARGTKYRLEYDKARSDEVGEDAYLLYYWSNTQDNWMWTQEDYWGSPKEIADEINTYRHGDKTVVLFEPDQIKSSEPVEYDDNGNIIPLSERFNTKTDETLDTPLVRIMVQ